MMTKLEAHKETVGELKKKLIKTEEDHEITSKKLRIEYEANIQKCKEDKDNALEECRNQFSEQFR